MVLRLNKKKKEHHAKDSEEKRSLKRKKIRLSKQQRSKFKRESRKKSSSDEKSDCDLSDDAVFTETCKNDDSDSSSIAPPDNKVKVKTKHKKGKKKKKFRDSSNERNRRKSNDSYDKSCYKSGSSKKESKSRKSSTDKSILIIDSSSESILSNEESLDSLPCSSKKKPSLVYPVVIDGLLPQPSESYNSLNNSQNQEQNTEEHEEIHIPIVIDTYGMGAPPPNIVTTETSIGINESINANFQESGDLFPNIAGLEKSEAYSNYPNIKSDLITINTTQSIKCNPPAPTKSLKEVPPRPVSQKKTHLQLTRKSKHPYSLTNSPDPATLTTLCQTGFESLENTLKSVNKIIDSMENAEAQSSPRHFINKTLSVPYVFSMTNKVIIVLEPKTQFAFLGKVSLKVVFGAVMLYGTTLSQKHNYSVEIYSSKGSSPICISSYSIPNSYDKNILWEQLISLGVQRSFKTKLHEMIEKCQQDWAIIILENIENNLTTFLNNYCPYALFPKIESIVKYPWNDPKQAELVLQASLQFGISEKETYIHSSWEKNLLDKILYQWITKKLLKTMIIGGKGVGKSTASRYLVNKLLPHSKKVIFIDLDPGQTEFTPCGCLSINIIDKPLLGPNYTHLKSPFYQLYLQDISMMNCVNRYVDYVKNIFGMLISDEQLLKYPVIVNTMGFCKGIGFDLTLFILKLMEPTDLIQISSSKMKNNFDITCLKHEIVNKYKSSAILTPSDNVIYRKQLQYSFHLVRSSAEGRRPLDAWNMEPRQKREIVMYSYLSSIIENAEEESSSTIASHSINSIVPYELKFSSFCITVIKSSLSGTHILAAMNGNLVGLCGINLGEISLCDGNQRAYPLVIQKPPPCPCYGFGVVRGIDMDRKCLYINTPLDRSVLKCVNLLAGCEALPFSLLHADVGNAPYSADKGELPTGQETRRGTFRVDQNK